MYGQAHADLDAFEREGLAPAWILLLCGWLLVGAAQATWQREPGVPGTQASRSLPVDLRTATLSELRGLPGIGPRRAVDYARVRWQNAGRPFPPESVPGIGPLTARSIRSSTSWPPSHGVVPP